jgi:hypothetical protein
VSPARQYKYLLSLREIGNVALPASVRRTKKAGFSQRRQDRKENLKKSIGFLVAGDAGT